MPFTRLHFFPVAAAGPARRMRENDMTTMTSWDMFEDLRSAQDELLSDEQGPWPAAEPGRLFRPVV